MSEPYPKKATAAARRQAQSFESFEDCRNCRSEVLMFPKYFISKIIAFSACLFCAFAFNSTAQNIKVEKNGTVAGYVREKDEETGIVRKRVAETESLKPLSTVKFTPEQINNFEKQVFALINQKRAELNLPPLTWSEDVAKIARLHSENMVKFNFFAHKGIDGKMVNDRADDFGLTKWTALGENIAYNRGYRTPLETAVEKWMLSPGHKDNLLDSRWKESAVGIAVSNDGTYFFTQVFIKRK